jgi:hypothetical protein
VSTSANARIIEEWSYDKLSKRADVVVVATVISTEGWDDPSGKPQCGDAVFEGRLSRLDTKGVLKGEVEGDELKLVHYIVTANGRINEGGRRVITSVPYVAEFQEGRRRDQDSPKGGATKNGADADPPHYLLFLKQRKDGKFEPVSGQVDSACSVMLLKPEGPASWHRDPRTELRDAPPR